MNLSYNELMKSFFSFFRSRWEHNYWPQPGFENTCTKLSMQENKDAAVIDAIRVIFNCLINPQFYSTHWKDEGSNLRLSS